MPFDQSSSWYEGIACLQPGRSLVMADASPRIRRFWRIDAGEETRFARDSDYVEAFGDLWRRVVRDQMRSRGATGIMLSGGLDSTAVAAVAATELRRSGRNLHAFTEVPPREFAESVPDGWYADETPYVRATARRFPNIDLDLVTSADRFLLDGIETYFAAAEAPVKSGFNRLWIEEICSRAAGRGIAVMLTGQAGNLTISWYGSDLIPKLIAEGRWPRALGEAAALVRAGHARSVAAALSSAALPYLPGPLWSALLRARYPDNPAYSSGPPWRHRSLIAPGFAREQRIFERARDLGYDFRARTRPGFRRTLLGRGSGSSDLLRAHEALFGVQFRNPADDQRIVEFSLSLPEDQFLKDGVTRRLIRRAMDGLVPEEILHNTRRGLQSSARADKMGLGSARLEEELMCLERSALARHAIDLPRLRGLIGQLSGGGVKADPTLSLLVASTLVAGRFFRWAETGN
jgi:asparagine synthase (glutamine-hydrolysing)